MWRQRRPVFQNSVNYDPKAKSGSLLPTSFINKVLLEQSRCFVYIVYGCIWAKVVKLCCCYRDQMTNKPVTAWLFIFSSWYRTRNPLILIAKPTRVLPSTPISFSSLFQVLDCLQVLWIFLLVGPGLLNNRPSKGSEESPFSCCLGWMDEIAVFSWRRRLHWSNFLKELCGSDRCSGVPHVQ